MFFFADSIAEKLLDSRTAGTVADLIGLFERMVAAVCLRLKRLTLVWLSLLFLS